MSETTQKKRAVVIMSGGLDSTVLLYYVKRDYDPWVLSFDYGQRHVKELGYAAATCAKLEVEHEIVDLTTLQGLLRSSLTFSSEVPQGHYAQDNMKQTIVPNRNAIMLSIAYGYALSIDAAALYIGAHAGDHAIYPDCRDEFFNALSSAFRIGSSWSAPIAIERPFQFLSKMQIVELGSAFHVPFAETWSCYEGGDLHCGKCGTCVERAEAFALAGVPDPTKYRDSEYWKQVVHA